MPRLSSLHLSPEEQAEIPADTVTLEKWIYDRCTSGWDQPVAQQSDLDRHLLSLVAPQPQDGSQLFQQLLGQLRSLPTCCQAVDALLGGGGIREGTVVELAGSSSSGKTQICHSLVAATAGRPGEGVVYIDTTNSFSPVRVMQIAAVLGQNGNPDVLSSVTVCRAHTVYDLLSILDELSFQLAAHDSAEQRPPALPTLNMGPGDQGQPVSTPAASVPRGAGGNGQRPVAPLFTHRPTILVVDSVSAVISPLLGNPQHAHGYVLTSAVGHALKSLAAIHRLAVLITNHATSARAGAGPRAGEGGGAGGGLVAAMGDTWRNVPHARLQLSVQDDPQGVRTATLTHSSNQAVGAQAAFCITAAGCVPPE